MEKIDISGTDRPLRAWHYSTDHPLLCVICHGFKGFASWGFFPFLCESLQARGIPSVRFDFSHNGTGDDPIEFDRLDLFAHHTFGREIDEIGCVVAWAKTAGYHDVVLLGHSRGGGTALLSAAENPVAGVVTLSGIDTVHRFDEATIETWRREGLVHIENARTNQQMPMNIEILNEVEANPDRFDILARAAQLNVPCWHWHGTADDAVDPTAAERLAQASGGELWFLEGSNHVFEAQHPFVGSTPALDRIVEAISGLSYWS